MHACGRKRIQPAEAHSLWALYAIAKSTLPLYWLHSVIEIVVAAGVASAPVAMQRSIVSNKTARRNSGTSALFMPFLTFWMLVLPTSDKRFRSGHRSDRLGCAAIGFGADRSYSLECIVDTVADHGKARQSLRASPHKMGRRRCSEPSSLTGSVAERCRSLQ